MNVLFACDIDNTLLYSYKKKQDGYICVEISKGKEQGFMSQYTYYNFTEITKRVKFIPVTTRSVEQYRRIVFPYNYIPEYALVSNGAILLHNSNIQSDWNLVKRDDLLKHQLSEIYNHYCNDKRFINCRIVDESYVFVYCASDTDALAVTFELSKLWNINIELSGRKIYFFPEILSKGNAVSYLKNIIQPDYTISAGDSTIDISMLNMADMAIIPSDFNVRLLNKKNFIKSDSEYIFSDFVINQILKINGSEIF